MKTMQCGLKFRKLISGPLSLDYFVTCTSKTLENTKNNICTSLKLNNYKIYSIYNNDRMQTVHVDVYVDLPPVKTAHINTQMCIIFILASLNEAAHMQRK